MSDSQILWMLTGAPGGNRFPNLHVVGVFTTRQNALAALASLRRHYDFILYKVPVDKVFCYVDAGGLLRDGMGSLQHEHFAPNDVIPHP